MTKQYAGLLFGCMLMAPGLAQANSGLSGLDLVFNLIAGGIGAVLFVPPLVMILYHLRCHQRKTAPTRGWLLAQTLFAVVGCLAGLVMFGSGKIPVVAGIYTALSVGLLVHGGRGLMR